MERSQLDRVRAWIAGELSEAEAEAVRIAIESDAELARFAEDYRAVVQLSASSDEPVSRTSFDDVWTSRRVRGSARRTRWWTAAAAIAAGLVGLLLLNADPRGPAAVHLAAIPREVGTAPPPPPALPARLASYEPLAEGSIQWFTDLDEAHLAARLTGRQVFVFGAFPDCPVAQQLERTSLADAEVQRVASEFVPVQLDIRTLDVESLARVENGTYPLLEVRSPNGAAVDDFSGMPDALGLHEHLARAADDTISAGRAISWERARELADLLDLASRAESSGDPRGAARAFERLCDLGAGCGFESLGEEGLARLAREARSLLDEARTAAEVQGAKAAERVLERALASFADTPWGADLASVLESLRTDGAFPELLWS